MKNTLRIASIILSILLIHSCKKDKPSIPVLTTTVVTAITKTAGTSGGNITNDGGATVLSRGVCWSTNNTPTIADNKTQDGAGAGSFISAMTGLSTTTIYFVRAYATNSSGTGYGMALSFTTLPASIPVLSTTSVSSITQTSAICGGTITSDGDASITSRGVCWSTTQNPTTSDSKTSDGNGPGSFSSVILGLIGNTTYFIRAYATNSAGTQYGNQLSFKTSPLIPTITTTSISAITPTTAISGGNISSDGGGSVTTRGVCWNTTAIPTIANSKTSDGAGTGVFISSFSGLTGGTTYYIRAYATNNGGTAYGNEISFTTTSATVPTITTTIVSSVTSTSATSGGNINSDGGANVTARGVCWSISQNPTIGDNKSTNGVGTGIFTSSITGLIGNTTYFIRAYATNSVGTVYGGQIQLITLIDYTGQTGTVTDIDGNTYPTIGIGNQIWMAGNLKTTKYRNGDIIATTTPPTLDISGESSPKYQWAYDGNESNAATYGRLYTWYAVTDGRNVCPISWHVPNDAEWTTLTDYLTNNNYGFQGSGDDIAKSMAATSGWSASLTAGTVGNDQTSNNSSGFTAMAGSRRNNNGIFQLIGVYGYWWSSSAYLTGNGWSRLMFSGYSTVDRGAAVSEYGFSVRCLKDN